jgi:hypothetical protein
MALTICARSEAVRVWEKVVMALSIRWFGRESSLGAPSSGVATRKIL